MVNAPAFPNRRVFRSIPPAFSPPPEFSVGRVFLSGPIPGGWLVQNPLPVSIERDEDGTCIVSDDIFLVYGSGDSLREALRDYLDSLIGLYRLTEISVEANAADELQWEHLQSYLRMA